MSRESRLLAGVVLITVPAVMFGGLTLLSFLVGRAEGYVDNPLRQDMWRAGHAHAGVYLVLALVMLRYVDEAALGSFWKWVARLGAPIAALLIPAGFFLSTLSPATERAGVLVNLAYPGAAALALSVLTLGVGLIRSPRP
jgi:hypothetical protein